MEFTSNGQIAGRVNENPVVNWTLDFNLGFVDIVNCHIKKHHGNLIQISIFSLRQRDLMPCLSVIVQKRSQDSD